MFPGHFLIGNLSSFLVLSCFFVFFFFPPETGLHLILVWNFLFVCPVP